MTSASAEQLRRERRQQIEAQRAGQAQHQKLRSTGRESLTPYGAAMIRHHGEAVRDACRYKAKKDQMAQAPHRKPCLRF